MNIKINNSSESNTVTHLNLFIRDGIFISNLSYTLDHEIQVVQSDHRLIFIWMLQIHHRKIWCIRIDQQYKLAALNGR